MAARRITAARHAIPGPAASRRRVPYGTKAACLRGITILEAAVPPSARARCWLPAFLDALDRQDADRAAQRAAERKARRRARRHGTTRPD